MAILLKRNKLIISDGTSIDNNNRNKIELLNQNKLYSNDSMNFFGRQLTYYLCNSVHLDLSNPEPTDLSKNTLAKILMRIKIIDKFLKLPLEKYTPEKFNQFMSAFKEGKIKSSSNRNIDPDSLKNYVVEFKRFFKIYRAWVIENEPKKFSPQIFEWSNNLKSPRLMRTKYAKYPYMAIKEIRGFAKKLHKEEYELRVLLSVNLMARKVEMSSLKYKHIEFRPDNKIWVRLPDIKKHSSEKVSVQVYDFILPLLNNYLAKKEKWNSNDLIFPTKDTAFARHLERRSEEFLKERITVKTLRKLGVCVAEELGYSRSDVERIGGWAVNTQVLSHYFNRKGVALSKKQNTKLNKEIYPDLTDKYNEMDSQNRVLKTEINELKKKMTLITASVSAIQEIRKR